MPWDPNAPGATAQQDSDALATAREKAKPVVVSGNQQKYRREFNDPTLAEWDVVTGAGMTVAATGGNLVVTTGTTVNATTTLTSKTSFGPPFNAAFGFKISQKIANQDFYLEMVAENADGTLDETVVAAWRISGTDSVTTTVARAEVRNGGAARLQSANLTQTTQTADSFYEITIESDEVWFHSRVADSTAGRAAGYVRNTVAPDPNRRYRPRIRIINGGTAPASTTTVTLSALTVIDYTEIQAQIQGGAGNANAAQGMPVSIVTGATTGTPALAASATTTGTTIAKVNSAASTNATLVKSTAGRLYGYHLANTSAAWRYFKLHNATTAPTVGTTAVAMVVPIPPGGSVTVDRAAPISFATGISYSIVTGAADADATAVGASEVIGHLLYI